ncbi:hypothetical protein HOY82DRAFT_357133 [Tuber indicum]|nr:hypothetical protein HOY82DRAFT_357133 [Tuber indicum]
MPKGFRCPNMAIVGSPSISSSIISAITENLGYKRAQRKKRVPCDLIRPHSKAYRKLEKERGEQMGRGKTHRLSELSSENQHKALPPSIPRVAGMLINGRRQSCIDTVFEGICYCAVLPAAPLPMLQSG